MYPDQSLYPADSVPAVVRRINATLKRADELHHAEGNDSIDWFKPIVADAEAGFGGVLNAFELMKQMIDAGAAGVHFEDQLSSAKKCGHMGGKVLVPTQEAINKLAAARLAADVSNVPTVLLARTDAESANLLTSDVDERDRPFIDTVKGRTAEGFFPVKAGIEAAIARGIAYAPYADLLWCETGKPDLEEAKHFAEGIHRKFPGKLLAYNCSPSFNWKRKLDDTAIAKFQRELGAMGYKFQFITLAGFHALNFSMFELARGYKEKQMTAYVALQQAEFAAEGSGYTATKHQREVGAGYFDDVTQTVTGGNSSITALGGQHRRATVPARITLQPDRQKVAPFAGGRARCPGRSPPAICAKWTTLVCAAAGSAGGGAFFRVREPDDQDQRQEQQAGDVKNVIGGEHERLLVHQPIQHCKLLLLP